MHGLEKFNRDYASEQAETIRNVIERADILALQEVGTQLALESGAEYNVFDENIMQVMSTGRDIKAINYFAFVYNTKKFSVVPNSCKLILTKKITRCSFRVI